MKTSLNLQGLKKQLSHKQIPPFYFIMGPEAFLIQESLKCIKSYVLSPETMDFNYEVFRAGEEGLSRVREVVETLPVLSEKRMIVCESAHKLKDADRKTLLSILKSPVETCVLVFVSSAPDRRKKIIKELMSYCEVVLAEPPKEKEWDKWIQWMGQKEGLSFSPSAIPLIKEYACLDLMNLNTEVKKLKSFLGSKKHISKEDVLAVVPRVRPENVFALSEAIGQRDMPLALLCLSRLLEDNHNEVGALALISRHIRILIRVKEGLKKGNTEKTICDKTGVPSFFIRKYIQSADLWTEKKMVSALEALKATDKALKSSPISAHIWLENFIIKACSV